MKVTLFYLAKSATQPQPFYVWRVAWRHKELLSSSAFKVVLFQHGVYFLKRNCHKTYQKKKKDIDTTWINDLRNLWGNWEYRLYWDRKRNNLINSCRCKKNLHISCVISINQQWILLACIFSFKNTHNSNVSKGKKTGRRSWLLYRRFSCNHSIHSRSISRSLQRSRFFCLLFIVGIFYLQPKTKHLIFSFQKRRTSRELCHSFTGCWESLARITSFRCPMRAPCL